MTKHGVRDGTYIDFGVSGNFRISSSMRIINEIDPNNPQSFAGEESELRIKRLQFLERIGYSADFAIGRNGLGLFGQYRLSDLFKAHPSINDNRALPQIAPLVIGLRIELGGNVE